MNWFRSRRVGVKLVAGFLLVAAIAAIIGGLGLWSTNQVNQMAALMYNQEVTGIRHASQAQLRLVAAGRSARSALVASDKGSRITEIYAMRDHLDGARAELEKLYPLASLPDDRSAIDNAKASVEAYRAALENFVASLEAAGLDIDSLQTLAVFEKILSQANGAGDLAEMLLAGMVLNKQNTSADLAGETTLIYEQSLISLSALTLAGAIVAVLLGAALTRGLTRQLGGEPAEVVRVVNAIAQGDLTTHVNIKGARKDSIMSAMEQMRQSLASAVSHVHQTSDAIAVSAHQIEMGNNDLSRRTEMQVASLTQTAAAMEELSGTVASNSSVSLQAAQMAVTARDCATRGGEVVEQVMTTMTDITEASRRVVEIIGLIDSIAFQTNILALNAAVEAARAGEQGRGFAVVANEVRALAQKSATAARDIKLLISNSGSKIDAGSELVSQAGLVMTEIVRQVGQVADLIQDISSATQEQTDGIAQVNQALADLMGVNQQNALLVDQSAQSAESLSHQASHLLDAMDVFHVGSVQESYLPEETSVVHIDPAQGIEFAAERYAAVDSPAFHRAAEMTRLAYRPMLA